eukprot:Gb_05156 [translate_table: standard]
MMEVQTFLDAQTSGRNPHLKIISLFFQLPCKDFKAPALNWVQKWKEWAISDDRINVVKWKEAVQKLKCIKDNRTDLTYIHGIQRILKIMKPVMENLPCRATGVGKGARLFGMYGVFGSGKTTLCKILYTHYLETFNDRYRATQLGVGFSIVELQKKVLTELTQASNEWMEELTDSDIGQKYVKEHMTAHKVVVTKFSSISSRQLPNALRILSKDKAMVSTSDYGEYHLMVKKLLVKNLLGSTALIFNQDVESIYVEEMGRKLSKWEVYDIFMLDFLKWGIEVDWRDFFPYMKWVPFKRFEENLSRVDRRRDAVVKALIQEQKQLLASGKVFWTCVSILPAMYFAAMVVGVTSSFVWTKGTTTSGSHLGFRASEGLTVKMVLGT